MIYVTGDMHGDIERFRSKALRKLKKNDYLIVCGDFGFLWDDSKKERKLLKWIGKRRYHVLFLEGPHDNLELLSQYPATAWNGGIVREISGRLKHLCRGGVFQLEDKDIFVFGGGESEDTDTRTQGKTWWKEELPAPEEIQKARENLARHNNAVDYIITHQCSWQIKKFLTMEDNDISVLDAFLDEVRGQCTYKRWFFGSYHINKQIPPREVALFSSVVAIIENKLPR